MAEDPELINFLTDLHINLGYPGQDAFWLYVNENHFGIATRDQVRQIVKNSVVNQLHQPVKRRKDVNVIITNGFNQLWQMDITEYRNRYIVVIVDSFSRYGWAKLYQRKTAHNVASFLRHIFVNDGIPVKIQTDNGSEFKNAIVEQVMQEFHVKHIFSKTYSAQANGYVERLNRTIKGILERNRTAGVNLSIAACMNIYNRTYHSATKKTPLEMHSEDLDEDQKDEIVERKREQARVNLQNTPDDNKFNTGDIVRITMQSVEDRKLRKDKFKKGYKRGWSLETTVIDRKVIPRVRNGISKPTYYYLSDFPNHKFYSNEIQKVG